MNGPEAYSIHVHNPKLWDRVLAQKQLGLAESYMDGWWDCQAIDQMLTKFLAIDILTLLRPSPSLAAHTIRSYLLNNQTKQKAASNAKHHYNIGNDLYARMLDPEMAYSCGYWAKAKTLPAAQIAKFDLIARKLAKQKSKGLGITFIQQDYRDLTGQFDRIVSVGMMEHVGPKNYKTFFAKCNELLAPGGMMLHHTITSNETKQRTDPFFDRYIFPGGVLPSLTQIASATEKKWIIEDVHNFGPDYDRTLMAWHKNINAKWKEIPAYDERFRRMWNYYLLSSAAGFRAGHLNLLQNVMRRRDVRETYATAR